jgi:hypothetical protein
MDAIDKLSPTEHALAARVARQYMTLAAQARAADKARDPSLRDLVDKAKAAAVTLSSYGIDVADDEDTRDTNFGLLVALLADPAQEQVPIEHSAASTSQREPYLISTDAVDFYEVHPVEVSPLVAAAWRRAQEEWAEAQRQMAEAYKLAVDVSNDHEALQSLFGRFEHEDQWEAEREAYRLAELELNKSHGPREWGIVSYQLKIDKYRSETRHRIHKSTCSSLRAVVGNSGMDKTHVVRQDHNELFVRRGEAIDHLRDVKTVACQRCAKELEQGLAKATLDESS